LPPPRPISEVDFRAPEGISPSERSAAFVAKSAHLFEGLKPRFATKVIKSRFIPMRDGVRLSTDFHIPLGAALPLPVILIRTPYGKNGSTPPLCAVFPEQGFILAYQDVRGRHESEGVFVANAGPEREDGYDTLEWLAAQPWCNGKIGAWGSSYLGETAARLSAMRHPNHRCSIIMFDGSNGSGLYQNGAFTQGGVTMLSELFTWMRDAVPAVSYGPPPYIDREAWFAQPFAQNYATDPVKQPAVDLASHLRTLPVFDLLERSGAAPSEFAEMMRQCDNPRGAYFDKQEFLTSKDQFNVPALHVAGLVERGDSAFANFDLFRKNGVSQLARDNQYLMFAPTPHSGYMSGA
jgi:predicted acyl esterase